MMARSLVREFVRSHVDRRLPLHVRCAINCLRRRPTAYRVTIDLPQPPPPPPAQIRGGDGMIVAQTSIVSSPPPGTPPPGTFGFDRPQASWGRDA